MINYKRVVVAVSGGLSSAVCADWALKNYPKDKVVLYFNDTKWEHPDLYRFINDLSNLFDHEIIFDSDGRNPEQLFYDYHAIANNRMPFCSKILKSERMYKYCKDKDILVFGIGHNEQHRAKRISMRYEALSLRQNKEIQVKFPILEDINILTNEEFVNNYKIRKPLLYELGFEHNNCSGGCVRAGKKQWKRLYEQLPEVYLDRERMEREISNHFNRRMTIFKDESLEEFRHRIETGSLSKHYSS